MSQQTRLTKSDIAAIEARYQAELTALPAPPTLDELARVEVYGLGAAPTVESVKALGYSDNRVLTGTLEAIAGAGRVVTLVIAETIQSGAALIIGVVFAVLEYWRVFHGAQALGQADQQAALIAVAVVVANVVHPIYRLRQLRGKPYHEARRMTGRGLLAGAWTRLTGAPVVERRAWDHNPVLDLAAVIITLTTVFLAVYDLIAPLLTSIITGTATKPGVILAVELIMGLGLSLAGVLFLQAAAHEIGVRVVTDQPRRVSDVLAERRATYDTARAAAVERARAEYDRRAEEHQNAIQTMRRQITADYTAGKLADEARKRGENVPFGNTPHGPAEPAYTRTNGHANGHGRAQNVDEISN